MNNKRIAIELNRIAKSLVAEEVADTAGEYKKFTGTIKWKGSEGKVRGATFELDHVDGILWKGGIWLNGTWEDGYWEDGIWEDGTWKDGVWEAGEWKKGFWGNGTWHGEEKKRGYWNGKYIVAN